MIAWPSLFALSCALGVATAAGLDFGPPTRELSLRPDEHTVTDDVPFTNTSDKVVEIRRYDASCSCTGLQVKGGKLVYQPGESGVLRASFDMRNFSGDVEKAVMIELAGDVPNHPSITLNFKIHIPVLVNVQPKTLGWDQGRDGDPQTISITMEHEEPIHILDIKSSKDSFQTSLKEIEAGKRYELTVTPASVAEPDLAVITIRTDCKIERQAVQRAFAIIRPPGKQPQAESAPAPPEP